MPSYQLLVVSMALVSKIYIYIYIGSVREAGVEGMPVASKVAAQHDLRQTGSPVTCTLLSAIRTWHDAYNSQVEDDNNMSSDLVCSQACCTAIFNAIMPLTPASRTLPICCMPKPLKRQGAVTMTPLLNGSGLPVARCLFGVPTRREAESYLEKLALDSHNRPTVD